jgi:hypothetical protein
MGLFDALQDIVGGISEAPIVQDVQEQASSLTEGAADAVTGVMEQGQSTIDDISQNFGL